ncbi:MAG: DUF2156 domain-containing protein [Oscillospiraceae bacterium]
MIFKQPTLDDKQIVEKYLKNVKYFGCEYSISNFILWAKYYKVEFCIVDDILIIRSNNEGISYNYPVGNFNLKDIIGKLIKQCEEDGVKFRLHNLTECMIEDIGKIYKDKFDFTFDESSSDYIYNSHDLINLTGKKYSAKRNHINKIDTLGWSYENIDEHNIKDCIDMSCEWFRKNDSSNDETKIAEKTVIKDAFNNFDFLGLKGGLIRLDNKVIAFSLGEEINKDVFVVHIEKAFSDIQGSYPLINREFIKNVASKYKYINREEDMGIEGLRKAKRSYHPEFLLKKHIGIYNG